MSQSRDQSQSGSERKAGQSCDGWSVLADRLLLEASASGEAAAGGEPGTRLLRARLEAHLEECPACRRAVGPLLETDRSLRQAFRALERTVPAPSRERLGAIAEAAIEVTETSRLLRRIRRPINTVLWITVLAFSLGALAALAWLLYQLTMTRV